MEENKTGKPILHIGFKHSIVGRVPFDSIREFGLKMKELFNDKFDVIFTPPDVEIQADHCTVINLNIDASSVSSIEAGVAFLKELIGENKEDNE